MDVVITYVNGLDPVWQKDYQKYTDVPVMEKRFRDWGTLKYLLRGVESHMPFIENVHLVVSHESQVPDWVDRKNLHVVLHSEFIPAEFLPTFNCNTLEMHLHRISGLYEEYLYFNDDMFPVRDCRPEDFFREGKPVIRFTSHFLASGMYKKICRNSDLLASQLAGRKPSMCFVRPQHICSPMLKSVCEEVYANVTSHLPSSCTLLRTADNCNQYLFLDYMYYRGMAVNEKISNKHISVGMASAASVRDFLLNPTRNMVCINDVHLSEKRYDSLRGAILDAFETKFPQKSRFEI